MKALIEYIRPLINFAAIRPAISRLLTIGLLTAAAPHGTFARQIPFSSTAATTAAPAKDPAFEAKKAEVFKLFNIRTAKPGEYPITIFPKDKVPPPATIMMPQISWLDNDTIVYVADDGSNKTDANREPGSLDLISINLRTFKKTEIAKSSTHQVCYDYETHNISFIGAAGEGADKQRAFVYGTLGKPLKTFVQPLLSSNSITDRPYTNPLDCTFYLKYPMPAKGGHGILRDIDGYIRTVADGKPPTPGTYYLYKAGKLVKRFNVGATSIPIFYYDHFSQLYWHSETMPMPDRRIKVWRFDRNLNQVAEETYPPGPWGTMRTVSILQFSVKPGFLVGAALWGGQKLTGNTAIHNLTYLVARDGTITDVAEDVLGAYLAVSPDGCRAVTTRLLPADHGNGQLTGELAVIDICKKQ